MATAVCKIHSHVKADGTSQIYILVSNGQKRNKKPVGYSVEQKYFNAELGLVTSKVANYKNINAKINSMLGEYQSKIEVSKLTNTDFSLDGRSVKVPTFYDFSKNELSNQSDKASGTKRHYNVWLNRLNNYDSTTKISEINSEWVNRYKVYLMKKGGANETPIGKAALYTVFKLLKKIIKAGIRDGYITVNVLANVDLPKEPKVTKKKYLTPDEVAQFENEAYKPENEHFRRCTLWQIYGFYSGLRISDWYISNLTEFLKQKKVDLKQTKTGGDVLIPLYPKLEKAIENLIELGQSPLSEHQHNLTLKSFAITAKIKHDMTSHFARHTFGVYLAENDVPPQVAMKLLGHKNIRETMIYYELTHSKIASVVLDKLG